MTWRIMKYSQIICTCCMGYGAHEDYNERTDTWSQRACPACEGKGYITPERSDALWDEVKLQPRDKQETPHRG